MNERLLERLRELPEVEEWPSQFHGEPAFWIDGREFVHTHGDEEIEVRLTGKLISRVDDERVVRRTRTSDWVVVSQSDEELVLELAQQALEANRRVQSST
ncbi:MAG: luciferase family protein [Gaiellaceae bacterium]